VILFYYFAYFCFVLSSFNFCFCFCFCFFVFAEKFFPNSSSQRETIVDVGKMKEVAQEPVTSVEALETILDGVDLEAYKHCME
jgi:hypothetical protein